MENNIKINNIKELSYFIDFLLTNNYVKKAEEFYNLILFFENNENIIKVNNIEIDITNIINQYNVNNLYEHYFSSTMNKSNQEIELFEEFMKDLLFFKKKIFSNENNINVKDLFLLNPLIEDKEKIDFAFKMNNFFNDFHLKYIENFNELSLNQISIHNKNCNIEFLINNLHNNKIFFNEHKNERKIEKIFEKKTTPKNLKFKRKVFMKDLFKTLDIVGVKLNTIEDKFKYIHSIVEANNGLSLSYFSYLMKREDFSIKKNKDLLDSLENKIIQKLKINENNLSEDRMKERIETINELFYGFKNNELSLITAYKFKIDSYFTKFNFIERQFINNLIENRTIESIYKEESYNKSSFNINFYPFSFSSVKLGDINAEIRLHKILKIFREDKIDKDFFLDVISSNMKLNDSFDILTLKEKIYFLSYNNLSSDKKITPNLVLESINDSIDLIENFINKNMFKEENSLFNIENLHFKSKFFFDNILGNPDLMKYIIKNELINDLLTIYKEKINIVEIFTQEELLKNILFPNIIEYVSKMKEKEYFETDILKEVFNSEEYKKIILEIASIDNKNFKFRDKDTISIVDLDYIKENFRYSDTKLLEEDYIERKFKIQKLGIFNKEEIFKIEIKEDSYELYFDFEEKIKELEKFINSKFAIKNDIINKSNNIKFNF